MVVQYKRAPPEDWNFLTMLTMLHQIIVFVHGKQIVKMHSFRVLHWYNILVHIFWTLFSVMILWPNSKIKTWNFGKYSSILSSSFIFVHLFEALWPSAYMSCHDHCQSCHWQETEIFSQTQMKSQCHRVEDYSK